MSRRNTLPSSRRHIHVFDEDWDFIVLHYGDGAPPGSRVGAAVVCREIIHRHIARVRAAQNEALDQLSREMEDA